MPYTRLWTVSHGSDRPACSEGIGRKRCQARGDTTPAIVDPPGETAAERQVREQAERDRQALDQADRDRIEWDQRERDQADRAEQDRLAREAPSSFALASRGVNYPRWSTTRGGSP